jgi:hypothetical protein
LHLKLDPHNPVKSTTLELNDVDNILNFNPSNDYELLQQAGVTWGCFTGS